MNKLLRIIIPLIAFPIITFANSNTKQVLLSSIKNSPIYLSEVKKIEDSGAGLMCDSVSEVLTSKNYSSLSKYPSIFSMVILKCRYNPNDGLDAYKVAGLATISDGNLINFILGNINQPD